LQEKSQAQQQLHFSQLTHSFTNTILKDSKGFIWVGTQDGLLRYDSFGFKVFRYNSEGEYTLPNNYVKTIVEDDHQNLWLGTFGGGLVMWDRKLERFYSYPLQTGAESVHSLEMYNDSLLLIGSENGLFKFNIYSKMLKNLSTENDSKTNFINDLYVSEDKDVLVGTNEGLLNFNLKSNSWDTILNKQNLIVYKVAGKAHRIYVGTNQGLFIYNKRKATFENQISDKTINTILLIGNENWYVGTNTGIGYYNQNKAYEWQSKDDLNLSGLKSDFIHDLYALNDEIIWAATRKGIHQFSNKSPDFTSLRKIYDGTECSSTVLGMAEDKNSDIWVCSRDGLMHLTYDSNIDNWEGSCHNPSNTPNMSSSYTLNITADNNDDLWLAYRTNGFSKISEINGKWKWTNYPKVVEQLGGDGVNQVFQDNRGQYWLASRGKGLIKFDPSNQSLKFYDASYGLSHPYVFRLYQNEPDFLWVSTANGGLCKFNILTEKFDCNQMDSKNPSSISANMVLSTQSYSDGRLIACTTEGINILEPDGSFTKVNVLDGLPNNVIYAALEDDNRNLWISTNAGISKINLGNKSLHVSNYNTTHGLANTEFNQHSYLEHSSGLFLFGGVEGVTVFDPTKIANHKISAKIAFTEFQLFNKVVGISNTDPEIYSLPKSINEIDNIELGYNQNSVVFKYAALGINNSEQIQYQYMLDGLEKNWVDAEDRNYAPYPKLPHGKYTFKVRLTDLNGRVITEEKSVKLEIATPPWKSWWAYLVYAIGLVSLLFMISRIQKSRTLAIASARENERNVFREKLAQDFHDEAGNKITRISLITDRVLRTLKDSEMKPTLEKLQDNIQDLRLGMTDFIWVLDPGKDSLGETLRRFMDFANETFEYSDMSFYMKPIEHGLSDVNMPNNVRRHFILIMKEAITNIIKYASAKKINFSYNNIGNNWIFELSDDGIGFDIENLKRINGLNNMISRAQKIDGNLTIQSHPGKGTSIILKVDL